MASACRNSKGQITIPKEIRETLGVRPGDRIAFRSRDGGVVELTPETVDILSLRGVLEPEIRGVTLQDMEKAITGEGSGS